MVSGGLNNLLFMEHLVYAKHSSLVSKKQSSSPRFVNEATESSTVVPSYRRGIHSKTHSGCLKAQIVPAPIFSTFCYIYIFTVKFKLLLCLEPLLTKVYLNISKRDS